MKSSAAIAEKVNLGLSRRKNGGRVTVAKAAQAPKVDIDERQYLFFFADPRVPPEPQPRSSHRWGDDKISCWRVDVIARYCDANSLQLTNGFLQVCTICGAFRFDIIVQNSNYSIRRKQFRRVLFSASMATSVSLARPRCKGALK